jgi:hypothetical protein
MSERSKQIAGDGQRRQFHQPAPNPKWVKTFFYLNELSSAVNRENTSRETPAARRRFPKASKDQHERAATPQ